MGMGPGIEPRGSVIAPAEALQPAAGPGCDGRNPAPHGGSEGRPYPGRSIAPGLAGWRSAEHGIQDRAAIRPDTVGAGLRLLRGEWRSPDRGRHEYRHHTA